MFNELRSLGYSITQIQEKLREKFNTKKKTTKIKTIKLYNNGTLECDGKIFHDNWNFYNLINSIIKSD